MEKPTVITKSKLVHSAYYRGSHRCGNVAIWDETIQKFWYVEFSMGSFGFSTCLHPEDDPPNSRISVFVPFERLDTSLSNEEAVLAGEIDK